MSIYTATKIRCRGLPQRFRTPNCMDTLIRFENVSKCYQSGLSCALFPLKGVSLQIGDGERIVLLGKSGSGKTTFLNLLGGVDRPTTGRIFFGDQEISALPPGVLAQVPTEGCGFHFSIL